MKDIICPECGTEFRVCLKLGKREWLDGYHGECPQSGCGFWYFEEKSNKANPPDPRKPSGG